MVRLLWVSSGYGRSGFIFESIVIIYFFCLDQAATRKIILFYSIRLDFTRVSIKILIWIATLLLFLLILIDVNILDDIGLMVSNIWEFFKRRSLLFLDASFAWFRIRIQTGERSCMLQRFRFDSRTMRGLKIVPLALVWDGNIGNRLWVIVGLLILLHNFLDLQSLIHNHSPLLLNNRLTMNIILRQFLIVLLPFLLLLNRFFNLLLVVGYLLVNFCFVLLCLS